MSDQHDTDGEQADGNRPSRRTFMKATGVATAAAAIGSSSNTVAASDRVTDIDGPFDVDEIFDIDAMISDMTVAEKAGQLLQATLTSLDPDADAADIFDVEKTSDLFSEAAVGSVLSGGASPPTFDPEELVARINALQEHNIENSPHSIPFFFGIDGVHGANYVDGATTLPQRHNMGATRDVDLLEQAEEHTADVIAATGCHETFAPTIELQRDPRWGRYFEGISEDPKLLGDVSLARTRALESNDRISATVKHFAGYEVPHNGNDRAAANVSMRDLRETLLPPFEVALSEGAGMVMVNSGSVNGVPAHASHWLLTEVLRGEYGFEGVIISDWNDLYRMIGLHEYFPDTDDGKRMAIREAIQAGLDMFMIGDSNENSVKPMEFVNMVVDLVESSELSEERLDASVRRILQLKKDLGLFEEPYADESKVADLVGNEESVEMATDLARESMVLLKNDSATEDGDPVLPLSGDEDVLVTGPGVSPDGLENRLLMQHGAWTLGWQGLEGGGLSEDGPRPAGSTMITELEDSLGSDRVTHIPTTINRSNWWAADGLTAHEEMVPTADWMGTEAYDFTDEQRSAVEDAAPDADVVVVVIGEAPHNEGFGDRDSLALPETQRKILQTVVENTDDDTPIIGVEYAGSPRGTPASFQHLDALLYAGQPGTGGGVAITETLFGEYNPSGRLGFTWPQDVAYGPSYHNAWPSNRHAPLYPFGHGLSYTDFEYENFSVTPSTVGKPSSNQSVQVTVDVTNAGDMAGDHIVEVYNTQSYGSVMHRDRRVVGYERVAGLEPGETRTVEVDVDLAALEVVPGDVPGLGPKAVEAGEYELTVGGMTTTLTVQNTGTVTSDRHVPGRFDVNDDGELTVFDALQIYYKSKKGSRGR